MVTDLHTAFSALPGGQWSAWGVWASLLLLTWLNLSAWWVGWKHMLGLGKPPAPTVVPDEWPTGLLRRKARYGGVDYWEHATRDRTTGVPVIWTVDKPVDAAPKPEPTIAHASARKVSAK